MTFLRERALWLLDCVLWLRKLVFPMLDKTIDEQQAARDKQLADDRKAISEMDFASKPEVALDEARRIADSETERRRGADQKAATYLAVVAGLVPLVLTVATAVWDKKSGDAPTWVNMLILALAIVYVSSAGVWAFRVLKVASAHRLGASDIASAWKKQDPEEHLARTLLACTRLNHDSVNSKIDGIQMAHAFLLRAFLTFAFLLIFNVAWYLVAGMLPATRDGGEPWLASPRTALQASAELAVLRERLGDDMPASDALDAWCAAKGMAPAGSLVVEKPKVRAEDATIALQHLFRLVPGDKVVSNDRRIACGKHVLGHITEWTIAVKNGKRSGPTVLPPVRQIRMASRTYWPGIRSPDALPPLLFSRRMVEVAEDGRPVRLIVERYGPGVLGFAPNE